MSFLQRRVQPLRVKENPGYQYKGVKDSDRSQEVVLSENGAFHYVKRYFKKIEEIPS